MFPYSHEKDDSKGVECSACKAMRSEMSWHSLQGSEWDFRQSAGSYMKVGGLMLREMRLKPGVHYNVTGANLT